MKKTERLNSGHAGIWTSFATCDAPAALERLIKLSIANGENVVVVGNISAGRTTDFEAIKTSKAPGQVLSVEDCAAIEVEKLKGQGE